MVRKKTTFIRGGTVVIGQNVSQQDVLIEDEKIAAVGHMLPPSRSQVIDASGLLVLPGAVDAHVHFNNTFMGSKSVHDYLSGTKAAAFGGVTSVIDVSNQMPGKRLISTLKTKTQEAYGRALVDWGVHPVITRINPETLEEIPLLVLQGAPSVKCYMTYESEGLKIDDDDLKLILYALHREGGMLMVHAEDNEPITRNISRFVNKGFTQPVYHARSRPPEVENRAIQRCIGLAAVTGGRLFIVHMSTAGGMELVASARARGLDIYAETCTHYLVFSEDLLKQVDGIKWICDPPLRSKRIQKALWKGIKDGRISMVSSDDAAYSWEAKLTGKDRFDLCPPGIPGIEARVPVLFSEGVVKGRISLPRFVELVATIPAQIFGLAPKKGSLTPGADADLMLIDPTAEWTMDESTLHMGTEWSAYEDLEITGKILEVFSRGELIVDGNECLAQKGRGQYLHRRIDTRVRPSFS